MGAIIDTMSYFVKYNNSVYKDSLHAEAKGLKTLRNVIEKNHIQIKTPDVINVSSSKLTLTQIQATRPSQELQCKLGIELAKLHNIKQNHCGFESNNYIGLNPQKNIISDNWGEFFFEYRLMYQVQRIKDSSIKQQFLKILNNSKQPLVQWVNQNYQHYSILHGDLWSGNVLYDKKDVWLIDPALYYGDSEADLAMTEMFGGFSSEFYNSYQTLRPLSQTYPQKKIIYNLYHYLNHYNLFGSGYLSACEYGMKQLLKFS